MGANAEAGCRDMWRWSEVCGCGCEAQTLQPYFLSKSRVRSCARHFPPFPYSFLVLFSARWYLPFCFSQASSLSVSTKSDPKQAKIANRMTSSSSFCLPPGIWVFSTQTHIDSFSSWTRVEEGGGRGKSRGVRADCLYTASAHLLS